MFVLFVVVATSVWVLIDANNIGVRKGLITGMGDMSAGMWFVASLLLWIIAFPMYLIKRGDLKRAAAASAPPFVAAAQPLPPTRTNDIEQLERLAALRDRGALTAEEFERKKQQLLG
jgi:hypothetical protein